MSTTRPIAMHEAPKQLTFDLPLDPRFGAEDFLVSPSNEQAYGLIESWPEWPDTILLLVGPGGSGKSHLASIWATNARAWTVDASAITHDKVPHLVSNGALAIEDMDRGERDEAALFHLLNLAREKKAALLITSETLPDRWSLKTPDLLSRLRLAPSITLEAGRCPPQGGAGEAVRRQATRGRHLRCRLYCSADRTLARQGLRDRGPPRPGGPEPGPARLAGD